MTPKQAVLGHAGVSLAATLFFGIAWGMTAALFFGSLVSLGGIHREYTDDWGENIGSWATHWKERLAYLLNVRNWHLDKDDRWQAAGYPIGQAIAVAALLFII